MLLLLLLVVVVVSNAASATSTCPAIFQNATRVILQSPFLISSDPSLNFACHSCIAAQALNVSYDPMCKVPGMTGYDAAYPIERNCHCLTLGLTESCASKCLPNPYCRPASIQPKCVECISEQHDFCQPADTNDVLWNSTCYEACQKPSCVKECSVGSQCHPSDHLCSNCVRKANPFCEESLRSYDREWASGCSETCIDSCSVECNRVCGDGHHTGDEEECDDGNTTDGGDGCSTNCEIENGFICTPKEEEDGEELYTASLCRPVVCGDGARELDEECDDSNTKSLDGCSDKCIIETGFECDTFSCKSTCGDGVKASDEECDDGNTIIGDGCSATCTVEDAFTCTTDDDEASSVCTAICGDTVIAGVEGCDDGNTESGDGCSETCTVEVGYECNTNSTCTAICGDGIIILPIEECDDGNSNNADGCTASSCKVESGWECKDTSCSLKIECGNAVTQEGEECDDGNTRDSLDGCTSTCTIDEGFTCVQDASLRSTCGQDTSVCGDSYVNPEEECDDGNEDENDGCSSVCQVEQHYECVPSIAEVSTTSSICTWSVGCGNGRIEEEEECDNGNDIDGDGCSSTCTVEAGFTCEDDGNGGSTCDSVCGDGILASGREECDTGTNTSGDGCEGCVITTGYQCHQQTDGTTSECTAICGDNLVVEEAETCDDGNQEASDGCSASCQVENGYVCTDLESSGSNCTSVCGDGIVVSDHEECDDLNTNDEDGCTSSCTIEEGFSCDGTSCSRIPVCGNGYVDEGEICDDGNTDSSDGCSYRCRIEAGYQCDTPGSECVLAQCSNTRRDWTHLSEEEKATFHTCLNLAFNSELYQKLVGVHVYSVNDLYAHYTNGFVAWHRKWLLAVQNALRSTGGDCTCVTLPYWDWGEEAALMQTSGCTTKSECSVTMREFGGGGSVDDRYVNAPVYNSPDAESPVDTATGYCVLNDITKDWRSNSHLGTKYVKSFNASCPIIRRGWDDWRDTSNGVSYASPMVATSFLSLASSIGSSFTYQAFAPVLNGQIHILPHDNSGGLLLTFMSPADPLFILHHTNVDRIWAIWEKCHGCDDVTPAMRQADSECYSSTNTMDGVDQAMPFWHFNENSDGTYTRVLADDAEEFAEWWPQGFSTPGDMLSISSLGTLYAYDYAVDDLDSELLQLGQCPNSISMDGGGFMLLSQSQQAAQSENQAQILEYLQWLRDMLGKTEELVNVLKSADLFQLSWLESSAQSINLQVTDIAATCECMHTLAVLNERVNGTYQLMNGISAGSKRMWNSELHHPSCFTRLTDTTNEALVLERDYCRTILSNDFADSTSALVSWVSSSLSWITGEEAAESESSTPLSVTKFISEYFK